MGNSIKGTGEISFYNTLSPELSTTMLALGGVKKTFAKTGTTISTGAGALFNLKDMNVSPTGEVKINQPITNIGKLELGTQLRTRTDLTNGDTKVRFALTQKYPIKKGMTLYATEYGITKNFGGKPTYGAFSGLVFDNKPLFSNKENFINSEYIEVEYTSDKNFLMSFGFYF